MRRPHVIYLAIGFPPAAKSCAHRMRETANQFCAQGWDVTVVNLCHAAWERDCGLDHTLAAGVDPRVRVEELPLVREDLETDIRRFSERRALAPRRWVRRWRAEQDRFPEPVFGKWRDELERAVLRLHRRRPADLLLASCVPYVNLAAAWRLHEEHGVPYAVDFRDGWSIDVIKGVEAFPRDSEAGWWEERVLSRALAVWCVNDPIAGFYRDRHPEVAGRVRVVRNGYDAESIPAPPDRAARPGDGLTFGYIGQASFTVDVLGTVLDGWRLARSRDALVGRSRFELRGHFGAGSTRGFNAHTRLVREAEPDGVALGGAVPKAEISKVFAGWDALVLILPGGRYMTSGKVYEYMATALPVVSAHDADHDASAMLAGHPFWTGPTGLDAGRLADAFVRAARFAVEGTDAQREDARRNAARYLRSVQLEPAVRALAAAAGHGPGRGAADRREEGAVIP